MFVQLELFRLHKLSVTIQHAAMFAHSSIIQIMQHEVLGVLPSLCIAFRCLLKRPKSVAALEMSVTRHLNFKKRCVMLLIHIVPFQGMLI